MATAGGGGSRVCVRRPFRLRADDQSIGSDWIRSDPIESDRILTGFGSSSSRGCMSRLVREVRGWVLVERRLVREAYKLGRVDEHLDLAPQHAR